MEQNWCSAPKVALLGLVLLNCAAFLLHRISTQHSRSLPWHHPLETSPACSGAAVGAGPVLVGLAVGHQLPSQSLHTGWR